MFVVSSPAPPAPQNRSAIRGLATSSSFLAAPAANSAVFSPRVAARIPVAVALHQKAMQMLQPHISASWPLGDVYGALEARQRSRDGRTANTADNRRADRGTAPAQPRSGDTRTNVALHSMLSQCRRPGSALPRPISMTSTATSPPYGVTVSVCLIVDMAS